MMHDTETKAFEERFESEIARPGYERDAFSRDRARVIHSAGFRRLQGKTQVMGVGEGDFHRTRLTHSIECAQIGYGILERVREKPAPTGLAANAVECLPTRDLLEAACLAHDLGHPPFGHGGERALQKIMSGHGGFEGNGQTLRIVTRLEKYSRQARGINPTRRLLLAVLKYPVPYGDFDPSRYKDEPPKCYFDEEQDFVDWALTPFSPSDRNMLKRRNEKDRPVFHTLDCSIMELADDIAYGVHDLEDIAGRRLVKSNDLREAVVEAFKKVGGRVGLGDGQMTGEGVAEALLANSFERKQVVSKLVHHFVTTAEFQRVDGFQHPLLAHKVDLPETEKGLLKELKDVAYDLVVKRAHVQQLERRGQRVVTSLFEALVEDPEKLIPPNSLTDLRATGAPNERVVCDYVAGMTDSYAEKVYHRLFTPGLGSSSDEI